MNDEKTPRRRRLRLISFAGLAAVAALWAYAAWSQYRLEQPLVGLWMLEDPKTGNGTVMEFLPDGKFRWWTTKPSFFYWSVSGQEIVISPPERLPRALWPLARLFGWRPYAFDTYRYELTGDELTIVSLGGFSSAGQTNVYRRVPEP